MADTNGSSLLTHLSVSEQLQKIKDSEVPSAAANGNKSLTNLYPSVLLFDKVKHVYFILYNDLRLLKSFRHVARNDVEDALLVSKLWNGDVISMDMNANHLYLLCRSWVKPDHCLQIENTVNLQIDDVYHKCGMVAKYLLVKASKQTLEPIFPLEAGRDVAQGHVGLWHIAVQGETVLLYVENTSTLHHFEHDLPEPSIRARFQFNQVNGFRLHGDLLIVGQEKFNFVSAYKWKEPGMPLVYETKDAMDGCFCLLGDQIIVTRSDIKNLWSDPDQQKSSKQFYRMKLSNLNDAGDAKIVLVSFDFFVLSSSIGPKLFLYNKTENRVVLFAIP